MSWTSFTRRTTILLALAFAANAAAETVDLASARARALASSPELAAAAARLDAAGADVRQAGRLPNPGLDLEAENVGGDLPGTTQAETTVTLVQTLETGGKRRLRVAAARAGRSVREAELAARRRAVENRVDRAFVALLAAQERLAAARANAATAHSMAETVAALVDAGEVSPIEATRTAMESALAATAVGRAETDASLAATTLAATWGGSGEDLRAGGALSSVLPAPPEGDADLAALPEAVAREAEARAAGAEADLARRQAVPDLDLGVGGRRLGGTHDRTFVLSLGFTLPVFDRYSDAAAAARSRAEAARRERAQTLVDLAASWRRARDELHRSEADLRRVEDDVLPRAEDVLAAVEEGYRLGTFSFMDLLEARRSLAASRALHIDLLERRALARAEVIRLLPPAPAPSGGAR